MQNIPENNVANLRYFFTSLISSPDINGIIDTALTNTGNISSVWPGITYSMSSDEGKAILGTPIGKIFGNMLATHKEQMGLKTTSEVTVFHTVSFYNVLFNIVPSTFVGKGYLFVYEYDDDDYDQGCLISDGTWLVDVTCDTFTATWSGKLFSTTFSLLLPLSSLLFPISAPPTPYLHSSYSLSPLLLFPTSPPTLLTPPIGFTFTLESSVGPCIIDDDGALSCAEGESATEFTVGGSDYLAYNGLTKFFAADAPSNGGSEMIYANDLGGSTWEVTIGWEALSQ